jgi:hypothetical protein
MKYVLEKKKVNANNILNGKSHRKRSLGKPRYK